MGVIPPLGGGLFLDFYQTRLGKHMASGLERLKELVGGQAVRLNGFLRATEDIDILLPSSLENGRRATLALGSCARAHAYLRGRGYVLPEDVKAVARDVLRHRVIITYEAEAEEVTAEDVVTRILEKIPVP